MSQVPWPDRLWLHWRQRDWPGFHRAWRACRGPGGRIRFATRYGSVFALEPYPYIDSAVIRYGFYESEVIEALRTGLRPGGVLWDIGANFGLMGVTAAVLEPAATVVAFEPNPAVYRRLEENAALNRIPLRAVDCALSDAAGERPFQLGPAHNSGMAQLATDSGSAELIRVRIATGDGLVAEGLPAPTMVKIDVEGHELSALSGMKGALVNPRCRLVVFEDDRDPASAVKNLLRGLGFEIAQLERREPTDHLLANFCARKGGAA